MTEELTIESPNWKCWIRCDQCVSYPIPHAEQPCRSCKREKRNSIPQSEKYDNFLSNKLEGRPSKPISYFYKRGWRGKKKLNKFWQEVI